VGRHQFEHAGDELVPVHQQVKQRHRDQHGVAHDGQRHAAAQLERGHQRAEQVFKIGIEVLQHESLDAAHVQRDVDAELRQPGCEAGIELVRQQRHLLAQHGQFLGHDGHDQQKQAQQHHDEEEFDEDHRHHARQPPLAHVVQPVHQRRQCIGQHGGDDKRRQHRPSSHSARMTTAAIRHQAAARFWVVVNCIKPWVELAGRSPEKGLKEAGWVAFRISG
jgi:hypothetical protein